MCVCVCACVHACTTFANYCRSQTCPPSSHTHLGLVRSAIVGNTGEVPAGVQPFRYVHCLQSGTRKTSMKILNEQLGAIFDKIGSKENTREVRRDFATLLHLMRFPYRPAPASTHEEQDEIFVPAFFFHFYLGCRDSGNFTTSNRSTQRSTSNLPWKSAPIISRSTSKGD